MVRGPKTTLSPDSLAYLADLAPQDEVLARVERETSRDASVDDAGVSRSGCADAGAGRGDRCEERAGGRDVHRLQRDLHRSWAGRGRDADVPGARRRVRGHRAAEHRGRRGRGPGRHRAGAGGCVAGCDAGGADVRLRVPGRGQDRLSGLLRADPAADEAERAAADRQHPHGWGCGRPGAGQLAPRWSRSSTRRSRRTTAWMPRSRWSRTGSRSCASAEWRVVQPQAEQLAARARGASAEAPVPRIRPRCRPRTPSRRRTGTAPPARSRASRTSRSPRARGRP